MPHLLLIGLSHRTAPVALRERAHRTGAALTDALHRWAQESCINEVAMLSTCNRVEVILVTSDVESARAVVLSDWATACGLSLAALERHTYTYTGFEAVSHLMRVAAGLDSLILGESQILGQLVGALHTAQSAETSGAHLNLLLTAALHTGKRTRAETAIAVGARSVASAAAHIALDALKGRYCPMVAVLGVGEMGQAAARALTGRGVRVILLNRTDSRANLVAGSLGVESHPWAGLKTALIAADAVITATGAQSPVLTADMLAEIMHARRGRPLTVVDLAVPRAVEASAATLPDLTLYDIDALRAALDHNDSARQVEAARVERLCAEESVITLRRLNEREAIPAIVALRQSAHAAAQAELEAVLRDYPDLSDEARLILSRQTRRLVNQRLHAPTLALKAHAAVSEMIYDA